MKDIIKKEFGVSPIKITKLNGYDNINYLIKTEGESFIFKTYPATRSNFALLEAESQALVVFTTAKHFQNPKANSISRRILYKESCNQWCTQFL